MSNGWIIILTEKNCIKQRQNDKNKVEGDGSDLWGWGGWRVRDEGYNFIYWRWHTLNCGLRSVGYIIQNPVYQTK